MSTQIKCTSCGTSIEITEAIKTELKEKILLETQAKHQAELQKLENEKKALTEAKAKELEQLKTQITESARKEAIDKVRQEYDSKIQSTKEESLEREKQNKELQDQVLELMKSLRETKDEKDKLNIEYEKRLLDEQDRIKQMAKKEAQDELDMKIAEKDKKISDAEKQILDLQRKLQQGSQQLQGEVQELRIEEQLRREFPFDEIREVDKGVNGADILQIVRLPNGTECGTIIWESKRTKNWSAGWIQKLKDDQRAQKADLAVLVSNVLPQEIKIFGNIDGILVAEMNCVCSVSAILRQQLMKVHAMRLANHNKATKAEVVYNYLISNEFKQRIEVLFEFFQARKELLDKERLYFTKKWDKEEKEIQKVLMNTAGIYGDLQGLVGNAMPKVSYLELPDYDEVAD